MKSRAIHDSNIYYIYLLKTFLNVYLIYNQILNHLSNLTIAHYYIYDMKDQLIRQTIMSTQEDVKEIKDQMIRVEEKIDNLK